MSLVPQKIAERIQFYENHVTPFSANAVAIGITTTEATDLQTKTTAARTAYDAQQAAKQSAEAATLSLRDAVDAMSNAGSALIKKVRAKAEQVGGNSVYTLAEIPAPATPGPVGAPGTPFELGVTLKPNGSLELKWKCANPTGCNNVIYQVYRKLSLAGEYQFVGGTGSRKFVDATVPSGVPSVMYSIQATRSTAIGDAAEFVVNFGVNTGGGATIASVSEASPKLAA